MPMSTRQPASQPRQSRSFWGVGLYLQQLRHKGHKITAARRALLEVLCQAKGPLTPVELMALLRRHRPKLNAHKTTVYRELAFLCRERILHEVVFDDGQPRYELASEGHFHHVICLGCRKVDRVELDNDLDEAERLIRRRSKFQVLRHSLEFYGLCSQCR